MAFTGENLSLSKQKKCSFESQESGVVMVTEMMRSSISWLSAFSRWSIQLNLL